MITCMTILQVQSTKDLLKYINIVINTSLLGMIFVTMLTVKRTSLSHVEGLGENLNMVGSL